MDIYLLNTFTISMLEDLNTVYRLRVKEIDVDEFCTDVRYLVEKKMVVNAIGHKTTADLINSLCGTELEPSRIEVRFRNATIYIVQIVTRLPEGKVLSVEELRELLDQNRIRFLRVIVDEM